MDVSLPNRFNIVKSKGLIADCFNYNFVIKVENKSNVVKRES